jgi:hypothetical protein
MKNLITIILLTFLTFSVNSKIVYVNNNDEVFSSFGSTIAFSKSFDIDSDGKLDIRFFYKAHGAGSQSPDWKCSTGIQFDIFSFEGVDKNIQITNKNCQSDTLNYNYKFQQNFDLLFTTSDVICEYGVNKNGKYSIGFRITKINPTTGVNGFIYGYISYSLTKSGDAIIHGWYYNDAFNEPIIANNTVTYPYNGCIYQDTIKSYVTETIYDTIKVTKVKTIYDTIKVTKNIYKTIYDTTKITYHDTVHKILYDTIKSYITIHDTIHKTIYNTVTTQKTIYDTIIVPISVEDTLIVSINKKTGAMLRIWPNPAQQTITLDLSDPSPTEIIIVDQAGATIVSTKTNTQIMQIDVSQWSVGTYTINISQEKQTTTKNLQIIR